MDASFWHDRWLKNDIGFHLPRPHPMLEKFWSRLGVRNTASVLVPLCGKSLDMVWLADQGHTVIGNELSATAVDGFFAERTRHAAVTEEGTFVIKRAGPYEIWQGDLFQLPREATRRVGAVYDRAALVAMPHAWQNRYAETLARLTPTDVPVLLIALDYDPSEMNGPPFPVPDAHVEVLFAPWFKIEKLASEDGLKASPRLRDRGVTRLVESAFLLRRTAHE